MQWSNICSKGNICTQALKRLFNLQVYCKLPSQADLTRISPEFKYTFTVGIALCL